MSSTQTSFSKINSRQKFLIATGASYAFEYTGQLDSLIPFSENVLVSSPLTTGDFYKDLGASVTVYDDATGVHSIKLVLGQKVSGEDTEGVGSTLKWITVWMSDPADGVRVARVG
jgi:hypothetical protein